MHNHSPAPASPKELAKDLNSEFQSVKGFSATNLKYIRKWFQFYNTISQQLVDQLSIPGKRLKRDSIMMNGPIRICKV